MKTFRLVLICLACLGFFMGCPNPAGPPPPTYTVTYNGNGAVSGTVPKDANTYKQGASVTVLGNTGSLIKTGYSLSDWNTKADGTGTSYNAGFNFVMGSASITLYAQWTQNPTYLVTYNSNGAESGNVPVDSNNYLQGATVTVLGNTGSLVKSSCAFTGWNTKADGSGTTYISGATFSMGGANTILYAIWSPTYTVIYNANNATSGSVPVDSNAYIQGATVTVLSNSGSLLRSSYTFIGWNTKSDGTGTSYAVGVTFKMGTAIVNLYAQWTQQPTFKVTYDSNATVVSGTVPTDSNNYLQNSTVTVLDNTGNLLRSGYVFNGWNTQANGLGTSYLATATFLMGSTNVTLYALWTPTYTVTYDPNGATGGIVPSDSNNYKQNTQVTVLSNTGNLIRNGYIFTGWNTNQNGTGTGYQASNNFTMGNSSILLYAIWAQVVYYQNGATSGTVPVDNNSYFQGATVAILGNTGNLVNPGYSFAGWMTIPDGSGVSYAAGYSFSMGTSALALYAVWIPSNLTFTSSGTSITITGFSIAPTGSLSIPIGVTNIGDTALESCTSLSSVTLPVSIIGIGADSFYGCTSLTSINIPSSVLNIGQSVFYGCWHLTSITIPGTITTIEVNSFYGCSSLVTVNINSGVKNIGDYAFATCNHITNLIIPSSVTSIGVQAFDGCANLPSIDLPSGVVTIGSMAFMYCNSVISVTIPSTVTSIGGSAFNNCWYLSTVTFQSTNPPTLGGSVFTDGHQSPLTVHVPSGTLPTYEGTLGWSSNFPTGNGTIFVSP